MFFVLKIHKVGGIKCKYYLDWYRQKYFKINKINVWNTKILLTYTELTDKIGFIKIKKHLWPTDANYFCKQFMISATNT